MPLLDARLGRTRRPSTMPIALIGFAVVAAAAVATFALLPEPPPPPPPPLPPLEITWEPAVPSEGHLFLVRASSSHNVPPTIRQGVATPPPLTSLTGEAGDETLLFHTLSGSLASVAAVPVGARGRDPRLGARRVRRRTEPDRHRERSREPCHL